MMINIGIGALLISIWFTTLFLGKTIGLSMLLFSVPITLYIIYLLDKNNKTKNPKAKILIIPIFLLSSTYFIYSNTFFYVVNILAIPALIIIMVIALFNKKIEINIVLKKAIRIVFKPLSYMGEAIDKIKEEIVKKLDLKEDEKKSKDTEKIIKAIIITVPIALIIIWLLASADQVFGNIFADMFLTISNIIEKIQMSNVIIRIITTGCVFLYLVSYFYNITSKYNDEEKATENLSTKVKDKTTIKMILGVLNVVYLLFCIIQIKSLFLKDTTLNYAQYARQGFFQLMAVSLINLVTILIAKNGTIKEKCMQNKYINIMCVLMILFTFIILISAALRMYFYESYYGYTLLRLLVYFALATETILLIPTMIYCLDKEIDLPKTYFIIIVSMYVGLNFINIDNIIAKRNVDRYISTGKIDMEYLIYNTSTDSVKQIIRIAENPTNTGYTKQEAIDYLESTYEYLSYEEMDFRDFNLSIISAKRAIKERL